MAIKTATPKSSKRVVMSLMVFVLLAWFILMAWVSSLWCLFGFDQALDAIKLLSQKQTQAIAQFNGMKIANKVTFWFGNSATQELIDKVTQTNTLIKNSLNEILPDETNEFTVLAKDFIYRVKHVGLLMRASTQVLFIKLVILILAIPLFLLATTAGFVDGLNQRAIRTASLGRESSYVFHQLNRYFKRGLLLVLGLWLVVPVSITPAFVFVPVSLLLSIMVSITASRFKKYV